MHGTIGVESTYGKGSVFFFTIPQKIVDAVPAARLKNYEAFQRSIDYRIKNQAVRSQFEKLAAAYRMAHVNKYGIREQKVDFLITDDLAQVSEQERKQIKKSGGKICLLQNPMRESISDITLTIINKPFYSLNFCQLINGEEQVFVRNVSVEQAFTAPKAQILVVDDNKINVKVAKGLLAPYQMQIDVAEDGKQALQMVQQKKYDMVFMDHMMPVMDGIEATEKIREMKGACYQKLPIIALSANATSEAKEMFVQAQMDDFISKPIREKELVACIRKWLPEDLIEYGEKDGQDMDVEKDDLLKIDGLDVEEGIRNCGSKEFYLEILGDFYRLIDSKSEKLIQCVEEHLLRDFTIEVHALKNNARMIGAMELSRLFYQMEQLGNEEQQEEIEKAMPELLALYGSYKNILSKYGEKQESEQKQVSTEVIRETLMKLHDAVDQFDLDAADAAMKELETYALPEELKPMEEQLRAYVADVAMEDIMQLTEKMCEIL